MYTKTILVAADVAAMMQSVYEYNRRGSVVGVAFFDANRNELPVAYVEVIADEPGLAVRSKPEERPEETVRRATPFDPRNVPEPLSMSELLEAMEGKADGG